MNKQKNEIISTEEPSLASIANEDEEIELITDVEQIEELSDEAKKMQEKALMNVRERAMAEIDHRKIPAFKKTFSNIEKLTEILNDDETWENIKIKNAMDVKLLAEAKKIEIQNAQTLLRMDSVNTEGTAGEVFVGVEFSPKGGTVKVIAKE